MSWQLPRRRRRTGRLFYVAAAVFVAVGAVVVLRPSGSGHSSAGTATSEFVVPTLAPTSRPAETTTTDPKLNTPPVIEVPAVVTVARSGPTLLSGITMTDAQARQGDLFGVLLYSAQGTITIGGTDQLRFFAPNGGKWVPFQGPITAIRAALATMKYTPDAGARSPSLTIQANDLGHQGRYPKMGSARTIVIKLSG